MIEQNIQMALQQNQIFLEDAIDIRNIKNTALGNQVLKYRRIKETTTRPTSSTSSNTKLKDKLSNKLVKLPQCKRFKSKKL